MENENKNTTEFSKSGLYVIGRLKGVQDFPWSNKLGKDHKACIAVQYADKWGDAKEIDFEITIYPDEIARFDAFAEQHIGLNVMVGYSEMRKSNKDKTKSWVEHHFNRNCQLYLQPVACA